MSCTWSNILTFTAGATIGSVVTWWLLKEKYRQLAQDEIADVKARLLKKKNEEPAEKEDDKQISINFEAGSEGDDSDVTPEERAEYKDYASRYTGSNSNNETVKGVVDFMNSRPYVIPPEEFGEKSEHDTVSLTYYADGVLTDEWDNVIEDIDEVVGEDSLTHFGEYEDDSVFVRNDALLTDYEILLDVRKFSDVPPRKNKSGSGGD